MKILLIVLALACLSSAANASNDADIFTCASIKQDSERLSCFDTLAKMMLSRQTSIPENYILQRFKKAADK